MIKQNSPDLVKKIKHPVLDSRAKSTLYFHLLEYGKRTIAELSREFNLKPSTMHEHITCLRKHNYIQLVAHEGRKKYYDADLQTYIQTCPKGFKRIVKQFVTLKISEITIPFVSGATTLNELIAMALLYEAINKLLPRSQ